MHPVPHSLPPVHVPLPCTLLPCSPAPPGPPFLSFSLGPLKREKGAPFFPVPLPPSSLSFVLAIQGSHLDPPPLTSMVAPGVKAKLSM